MAKGTVTATTADTGAAMTAAVTTIAIAVTTATSTAALTALLQISPSALQNPHPLGSVNASGFPPAYWYRFIPSTNPAGSSWRNRPIDGEYALARKW